MYYLSQFSSPVNSKSLPVRFFLPASSSRFSLYFVMPAYKLKNTSLLVYLLRKFNLSLSKVRSFEGLFGSPKTSLFCASSFSWSDIANCLSIVAITQGNRMLVPFVQVGSNFCTLGFVKSCLLPLVSSYSMLLTLLNLSRFSFVRVNNAYVSPIIKILTKKKGSD
uniref:Uncharacterized protein n=1 Tax=Balamuthia mandrillaris TaxID=66527 RepID=A0A0K1HRI3_9EUKA|nr:hypothetical protein [Balamuthia mandrillaris]AKT94895.1 hypothetical protein [Balamuthia mandrillaris]